MFINELLNALNESLGDDIAHWDIAVFLIQIYRFHSYVYTYPTGFYKKVLSEIYKRWENGHIALTKQQVDYFTSRTRGSMRSTLQSLFSV